MCVTLSSQPDIQVRLRILTGERTSWVLSKHLRALPRSDSAVSDLGRLTFACSDARISSCGMKRLATPSLSVIHHLCAVEVYVKVGSDKSRQMPQGFFRRADQQFQKRLGTLQGATA